jgi:membrane protease YdiL (CAAX protease family)
MRSKRSSKLQRSNLLTQVVLVFPALLVYELGVVALGLRQRNGVDLITDEIGARIGYVTFSVLLLVVFAVLVFALRREQRFEWKALIPVLLESGIYALTMGTFIIFVMVDILHMSPRMALGVFDKVVLALGAGVHEELFFRLLLLGGLAHVLQRALPRTTAILLAFLISSALFSAAHHLGRFGDPFTIGVFTYRLLAGLVFATIYWFRGFAVVVYTHALYDVYVMILR